MKKIDKVLVSVIMSVYNEPKAWLDLSINSILNQSYKNLEFIIVIDNPNNIEAISTVEEFSKRDKRIVYIINEKNIGIVQSLNKAINLAKGKFIARMDADDISLIERIERQVQFMMKNRDISLVFSNRRIIDEDGNVIKEKDNLPSTKKQIEKIIRENNFICHPTWMVRKELYLELNGYRDVDACEDYDFILRTLNYGYEISLLDIIAVDYRVRQNGISKSKLFRQFLASIYIKNIFNQNNIEQYNIKKLQKFIDDRMKFESNYIEADKFYNQAKKDIDAKNYSRAFINIIKLIFKSKYYCIRLKELFMYKIYMKLF